MEAFDDDLYHYLNDKTEEEKEEEFNDLCNKADDLNKELKLKENENIS